MDLWDSILKAPILLKIVLFIIFAASFYTTLRSLLPVFRWLRMMPPTIVKWFKKGVHDCIWRLRKPYVELVDEPFIVPIRRENNVEQWDSRFTLRVQNRDMSQAKMSFVQAKMTVGQGLGIRVRKTTLEFDQSEGQETTIILEPKGVIGDTFEGILNLRAVLSHDVFREAVRLNEKYKWKIYGISVKLAKLRPMDLQPFKGIYKPACKVK